MSGMFRFDALGCVRSPGACPVSTSPASPRRLTAPGSKSMKSFSKSTTIRSTPEAVWAILIDAPGWPSWNTTVDKVEGRIAPGEKIKVYA